MAFQIDGSDVKDPLTFAYEERATMRNTAMGWIVPSAYRSAIASFPAMTAAEFTLWKTADDGATHSIKCYAPNSNTLTTYSSVYIEYVSSGISTGLRYYDVQFRVYRISTASLPAFGAQEPSRTRSDQTNWGTFPQAVIGFGLAIHTPSSVWTGTLTAPTYPADGTGVGQLTISTTSGNYANVKEGMTVKIANSTTSYYTYARKVPTSTVLYIDGLSPGTIPISTGVTTATVYNQYLPWPRRFRYNAGSWYCNFDEAYTNQNQNFGPQAIMGPTAIKYIDGSTTFYFDGSDSVAWTPASTIASYLWTFPDATTASTATATWTTSTAYPNGTYVHLLVTDSNGATHEGHRLLFKFDSSNKPKLDFEVSDYGGEWGGGYSCTIKSARTEEATETYTTPGFNQCVLFGTTAYGSTVVDIGGNYSDRWNIWLDGYLTSYTTIPNGEFVNYEYTLKTIDALLESEHNFALTMDDNAGATSWLQMTNITLDNIVFHYCRWRSTILHCVDVFVDGSAATTAAKKYMDLQAGSMLNQLRQIYSWVVGGTVSVDWASGIHFEQDAIIAGTVASLPTAAVWFNGSAILAAENYSYETLANTYLRPSAQYIIYGVDYATPVGSRAPDDPVAHGGTLGQIPAGLAGTQTQLNTWSANMQDKINNTNGAREYPLATICRVDLTPQVTVSVDGSTYTIIPRSVTWEFDAESGFAMPTYICEKKPTASGMTGQSVTFTTL